MTFAYWANMYDPVRKATPEERYTQKMMSIQSFLALPATPKLLVERLEPAFLQVSAETGWLVGTDQGSQTLVGALKTSSHHRDSLQSSLVLMRKPLLGRPPVPHRVVQPMMSPPRLLRAVKIISHRNPQPSLSTANLYFKH